MTATLPFVVIPTPLGTLSSGNERAEKPAVNLGEFKSSGLTWGSSGNSNLWVRGDFGSAKPVNFFSVMAANALPGTTINYRLGAIPIINLNSDEWYTSGTVPFISPSITRTDGLYHSHLETVSAPPPSRYWRIDIGGHTGDFEASMLVIGQKLTPANWYEPGWERGVQDMAKIDFSSYGVASEEPGVIWRTLSLKFGWMSESDLETMFGPLIEAMGTRGVSFWCFDPTSSVYRQRKTYFGWLRNSLVASHSRDTPTGIRYQQQFDLLSMF